MLKPQCDWWLPYWTVQILSISFITEENSALDSTVLEFDVNGFIWYVFFLFLTSSFCDLIRVTKFTIFF